MKPKFHAIGEAIARALAGSGLRFVGVEDARVALTIVEKGGKWCVTSEDGSHNFGCYPSEVEAKKRLGQVEMFDRMGMSDDEAATAEADGEAADGDDFEEIRAALIEAKRALEAGDEAAIKNAVETLSRYEPVLKGTALREEYDPDLHPRGPDGKWASAGGGSLTSRGKQALRSIGNWVVENPDKVIAIVTAIHAVSNLVQAGNLGKVAQAAKKGLVAGLDEAIGSLPRAGRTRAEAVTTRFSLTPVPLQMSKDDPKRFVVQIAAAGLTEPTKIVQGGRERVVRVYLSPEILRAAAPMYEGKPLNMFTIQFGDTNHAPMPAREVGAKLGGVFGNSVGVLTKPDFIEGAGRHGLGALQAEAVITRPEIETALVRLAKQGLIHTVRLSFDIDGDIEDTGIPNQVRMTSIRQVLSVDIVTNDAADGGFVRLAAAKEVTAMNDELKALLRHLAGRADMVLDDKGGGKTALQAAEARIPAAHASATAIKALFAKASAAIDGDDYAAAGQMLAEAKRLLDTAAAPAPTQGSASASQVATEAARLAAEAVTKTIMAELDKERTLRRKAEFNVRISASGLSPAGQAVLRTQFAEGAEITDESWTKAISGVNAVANESAARLAMSATARSIITVGVDERKKCEIAVMRMMGALTPEQEKEFKDIPACRGLHDAMVLWGHDPVCQTPGIEGVKFDPMVSPVAAIRASLALADFPVLLGTAMNTRLSLRFNDMPKYYREIAQIKSLDDFREQKVVRRYGFEDLATRTGGEDSDFKVVAVTENAGEQGSEAYTPDERGLIFRITRKVIKNDSIGLIRDNVDELARAAWRSINRFAMDLLIGWNGAIVNGVAMSDTNTIYHAAHTNLQTVALSYTSALSMRVAMAKQAEFLKGAAAGQAVGLGLTLSKLFVPDDLEPESLIISTTPLKPNTNLNDINPIKDWKLDIVRIPTAFWRGKVDMVVGTCNPKIHETAVIGFVDGAEDPLIVTQQVETVGNTFTARNWSYRASHERGGVMGDWRGVAALIP